MSKRSNRLILVGIALLFFTPLMLAVLMQSDWWHFEPAGTTNLGILVEPPVATRPVSVHDPAGEWTISYWLPGECDRACIDQLTRLRQVHKATGRDRDSVKVVVFSPSLVPQDLQQELKSIYPRFEWADDASGAMQMALEEATRRAWPGKTVNAEQAFLIDPEGNIILAYAPGFDANHIHRDLKRLLKWSKQNG